MGPGSRGLRTRRRPGSRRPILPVCTGPGAGRRRWHLPRVIEGSLRWACLQAQGNQKGGGGHPEISTSREPDRTRGTERRGWRPARPRQGEKRKRPARSCCPWSLRLPRSGQTQAEVGGRGGVRDTDAERSPRVHRAGPRGATH